MDNRQIDTWFPNPAEQALALLSAFNDDLEQARNLARANALIADSGDNDKEFRYWIGVRNALVPTEDPCAAN